MFTLNGKIALVTGGARSIGKVITMRLAQHGARVIVNCFHSYDEAKELQAELANDGIDIDIVRASVAKRHQVQQLFEEIRKLHGGLDILVNNAAQGSFVPVLDTTEEQLDRSLNVNLKGSLWCAQEAYQLMCTRGGGAIVNLSSVGASSAVGNYAPVGISKSGVESLTRYLATEFAPADIRVNTACGGLIRGDVADRFPQADEMKAHTAATTPLEGIGDADDLANVVLFLASSAARWVTGQTVVADGGQSLGGSMLTPPSLWGKQNDSQDLSPLPENSPPQAFSLFQEKEPSSVTARVNGAVGDSVSAARDDTLDGSSGKPIRGRTEVREADRSGDDSRTIAVVGTGLVVPGASNPEDFWDLLERGPELLDRTRNDRFRAEEFYDEDMAAEDKTYQTCSGYADDYVPHAWLSEELGAERGRTEYTTQWFRHAVYDAVRHIDVPDGSRSACVMGYTPDGNQHLEETLVVEGFLDEIADASGSLGWDGHLRDALLREARSVLESHYPLYQAPRLGLFPFDVATRAVDGLLPAGTQLVTIDTACSSAMYAVDIGMKGILEGRHDVAVCGGSFAVGPRNAVLFAKLLGLSPSGNVRPFDRDCDGVLFADGAAAVTLKRLDLAVRDGDPIFGYISSVGTSSDGKGKAIYAPNTAGQKLAIERAREKATHGSPDWIVAHATGTPAGDLSEITSIRELHEDGRPLYLTSNKALIGHTGWAAGVVSLIQVLLSFQKEEILPQHRFHSSPDDYGLGNGPLEVPMNRLEWKLAADRPRVAAVSGFGFGGTNAHMLIQDHPAPQRPPDDDDVVITAWSAQVPWLTEKDEIRAWLDGSGRSPHTTFGHTYDPSHAPLRMPPKALRTLDRGQLLITQCAEELRQSLGEVWEQHRGTTGVFLGHMGPTRHAVQYAKRCHLDSAFTALDRLPQDIALDEALRDAVAASIRGAVPASNEDSFPGIMPNVISARVSNHFGLNGPNMVFDLGFASTLGACEVASRYLRSGDIDLAVVGGVNGNTTPVITQIIRARSEMDGVELAEGAFAFAVTRRSLAVSAGLPVIATIDELEVADSKKPVDVVECGAISHTADGPLYLGAESALGMLRAIRLAELDSQDVTVRAHERVGDPPLALRLRHPDSDERNVSPAELAAENPKGGGGSATNTGADFAQSALVRRHVTRWLPTANDFVRPAKDILSGDAVVLTATPELLGELGTRPGDPLVLSVAPTTGYRRHHISASREAVQSALRPDREHLRHVRVITDLHAMAEPATALDVDPEMFFHLQEVAFLVVQELEENIRAHDGSVLGLFTNSYAHGAMHPYTGLFTGFLRSVALEFSAHLVTAVFTTRSEFGSAVAELGAETRATQLLPTTLYFEGTRHTLATIENPAETGADPPLNPDSVVVAVGGGHGITAEVIKAVAARYRPTIYVIGSKSLRDLAAELATYGGPESLSARTDFIRNERARYPDSSVREINAKFDRLSQTIDIQDTLAAMERYCGAGRVHYLHADVRDQTQLDQAFDTIFGTDGDPDLIIHAAGVNRASSIGTKTLQQFREVRSIKVQGYLNIRKALRGRPARMWCSFSSLIGLTGQLGETDYSAANEFLATAATYNNVTNSCDEFSIGWTLWKEVGMASTSVHQSFFSGAMANTLTQMPSDEGVSHFINELEAVNRPAATYQLGDVERSAVERVVPGYFEPRKSPEETPSGTGPNVARGRFYIDETQRVDESQIVIKRQFSEERDAYLKHHAVRGTPTLPGCFVAELAAEAATELVPDLHVVGFRDITFEHFLKLGGATDRSPRKITAGVRRRVGGQAVVDVRITADLVAPDGTVLTRNRPHFSVRVVLADRYPPAPRAEPWSESSECSILDPYHVEGVPAYLTGPFISTTDTRLHPLGKKAGYTKPAEKGSVFEQFTVPVLLLDGLARLAVLELINDRYVPVAAPTYIRRIDLHSGANDVDLSGGTDRIDLSVSPRGLLFDENPGAGSQFLATLPCGEVLVQMKDIHGLTLGYVDTVTRKHVDHVGGDAPYLTPPAAMPL